MIPAHVYGKLSYDPLPISEADRQLFEQLQGTREMIAKTFGLGPRPPSQPGVFSFADLRSLAEDLKVAYRVAPEFRAVSGLVEAALRSIKKRRRWRFHEVPSPGGAQRRRHRRRRQARIDAAHRALYGTATRRIPRLR